jgi:hypothetical protein
MARMYFSNNAWPEGPKEIGTQKSELTISMDDVPENKDFSWDDLVKDRKYNGQAHMCIQAAKSEVPMPPEMWGFENVRQQVQMLPDYPEDTHKELMVNATISFGVTAGCLSQIYQALAKAEIDLPEEVVFLLRDTKLALFHCFQLSKIGCIPVEKMRERESRDFFRSVGDQHIKAVQAGCPVLQDEKDTGNHFYSAFLRIHKEALKRDELRYQRDMNEAEANQNVEA